MYSRENSKDNTGMEIIYDQKKRIVKQNGEEVDRFRHFVFSIEAHLNFNDFKIAALNIHSVNNKLGERNINNLFARYVIFLNERKTSKKDLFSGFAVFQNLAKISPAF